MGRGRARVAVRRGGRRGRVGAAVDAAAVGVRRSEEDASAVARDVASAAAVVFTPRGRRGGRERVKAERAAATAKRAEEIRRTSWMSMEGDVRLKDIPSCDESAWTHEKIEELINFPPDVAARMEAHSVLRYDPRWPCDNTWIPPPEPDTWEFLKEIGRGSEDPLEDEALGEKLAMRNGITQRYEVELEAEEFLARSSEAQLQRAIDIGEDDDEDEEEEER